MQYELKRIFEGSPERWIDMLPSYQRSTIKALLARGLSEEDAAQAWLNPRLTTTIAGYGGGGSNNTYFEAIKNEFRKLTCGDKKYENERTELHLQVKSGEVEVISAISACLEPTVGVSASMILPVVALLLYKAAKIGISAWCAVAESSEATTKLDSGL